MMKVTKQTKFEFSKAEVETMLVSKLNLRQKIQPEIVYEYLKDADGKYSMEKIIITIVDSSGPEEEK